MSNYTNKQQQRCMSHIRPSHSLSNNQPSIEEILQQYRAPVAQMQTTGASNDSTSKKEETTNTRKDFETQTDPPTILIVGETNKAYPTLTSIEDLELLDESTLLMLPIKTKGYTFSKTQFNGSVYWLIEWSIHAEEATDGYMARKFTIPEFRALAIEAEAYISQLSTIPYLNNDSNKKLLSFRIFSATPGSGIGQTTIDHLQYMYKFISDNRTKINLFLPLYPIVSIEADPAEAHPNTLPTAKITFSNNMIFYFKGRSAEVEMLTIGSKGIAKKMSTKAADVGHHSFYPLSDNSHMAEFVTGPQINNDLSMEQMITAWTSTCNTAIMTSLTALTDIHSLNMITTGLIRHIIDAEFLLDISQFNTYQQAKFQHQIPNFLLQSRISDQLMNQTQKLQPKQKELLIRAVCKNTLATVANLLKMKSHIIKSTLESFQTRFCLLRIAPITTGEWLESIALWQNSPTSNFGEIIVLLKQRLTNSQISITLEDQIFTSTLLDNYQHGIVPLFHVKGSDGTVLMNKTIHIGSLPAERQPLKLLELSYEIWENSTNQLNALITQAILK